MKQIIKFGLIGTVGFIVDSLILLIGINIFEFSIEISRVLSFLIAVLATWILNRNYTFTKKNIFSKKKEYFMYLFIQTFGFLLNYMIFIYLIYYNDFFKNNVLISLAISSILAMVFNYILIKKIIFK